MWSSIDVKIAFKFNVVTNVGNVNNYSVFILCGVSYLINIVDKSNSTVLPTSTGDNITNTYKNNVTKRHILLFKLFVTLIYFKWYVCTYYQSKSLAMYKHIHNFFFVFADLVSPDNIYRAGCEQVCVYTF